jgi:hypothetical protein
MIKQCCKPPERIGALLAVIELGIDLVQAKEEFTIQKLIGVCGGSYKTFLRVQISCPS